MTITYKTHNHHYSEQVEFGFVHEEDVNPWVNDITAHNGFVSVR
jgi:hypothetical protein